MKKIITKTLTALFITATAIQAQIITSWNPYDDFYLAPSSSGWTGAEDPSQAGNAWGYYAGNVNGFGYPTQIGSYFTTSLSGVGSQSLYQFSDISPLGPGYVFANTLWDPTGGMGFARYQDNLGWGVSLGRYDNPWFSGAPGLSRGLNNLIWMQSGWLGGTGSEGIASVLSFTIPETGVYTFTGKFIAGAQGANGASVAIVDSLNTPLLSRTTMISDELTNFNFTKTYNTGDVVEFQVGSNFTTGNAVGLDLYVIPEPSSFSLLIIGGTMLYGLRKLRKNGS
ncbi:PEP-CTERM sorting domain-containing protein [bacterium]|nr:PEP-CTERM sorting domain-containing protein [Candidatus Elulimicrobium humile]